MSLQHPCPVCSATVRQKDRGYVRRQCSRACTTKAADRRRRSAPIGNDDYEAWLAERQREQVRRLRVAAGESPDAEPDEIEDETPARPTRLDRIEKTARRLLALVMAEQRERTAT